MDGDGSFEFEVVGEGMFQDSLASIAGPKTANGVTHACTAHLIPEPNNPHDCNAVAVYIDEIKIGYLERQAAQGFVSTLKRRRQTNTVAVASALICGGWKRPDSEGHYGVKLDIV